MPRDNDNTLADRSRIALLGTLAAGAASGGCVGYDVTTGEVVYADEIYAGALFGEARGAYGADGRDDYPGSSSSSSSSSPSYP